MDLPDELLPELSRPPRNSQYLFALMKLNYGFPQHDNIDYSLYSTNTHQFPEINYDWLLRNLCMFFDRAMTDLWYRRTELYLPKICLYQQNVHDFIQWCEDTSTIATNGKFITHQCPFDVNVICVYWLPNNLSYLEYNQLRDGMNEQIHQ